jgi:tRNA (guanine-N(7)-)-methyltransferase subunit TRM82
MDKSGRVLVSVDNVHEPGSTGRRRDAPLGPQQLLVALRMSIGPNGLTWEALPSHAVDAINQTGTSDLGSFANEGEISKAVAALSDSLYTVGNLRKRVLD